MSLITQLKNPVQASRRAYVAAMLEIVARNLVATSKVDDVMQQEIAGFHPDFTIQLSVLPKGPSFTLEVLADKTFKQIDATDVIGKPNLSMKIKHMSHAFSLFTFQEGTARAFANDRLVADGDVSHAIRFVRILDRMETLILPKIVAEQAVKQYPKELPIATKLPLTAKIYSHFVLSLLPRK